MHVLDKHEHQDKFTIYCDSCNFYVISEGGYAYQMMYYGEVVDSKIYDDKGHLKAVIKEE